MPVELQQLLPVLFGMVVGFSLGLTGGGGSIFAVPLLIYGLGTGVRESVGISLVAVGATALFGAALRLAKGEVEIKTGLVFATAGMLGAPVGTWIGSQLPDPFTLSVFALIMFFVGFSMWRGKLDTPKTTSKCERNESGVLQWNSRCAIALCLVGLLAGVLSGIFGVGGGFIIVPALILSSRMSIHRAVSTSLMIISLICLSGIVSYAWTGPAIPFELSLLFVGGGLVGMFAGGILRSRLSSTILTKFFAVGMWMVGAGMLWKNLVR